MPVLAVTTWKLKSVHCLCGPRGPISAERYGSRHGPLVSCACSGRPHARLLILITHKGLFHELWTWPWRDLHLTPCTLTLFFSPFSFSFYFSCYRCPSRSSTPLLLRNALRAPNENWSCAEAFVFSLITWYPWIQIYANSILIDMFERWSRQIPNLTKSPKDISLSTNMSLSTTKSRY